MNNDEQKPKEEPEEEQPEDNTTREKTFTELAEELDEQGRLSVEPNVFDRELEVYRDNIRKNLMDIVGKELARLTKLQREVLIRLYYKQESTYQLAHEFGIARQSIQKIQNRALETLNRRLGSNPYFLKIYEEFRVDDPEIAEILRIADILDAPKRVPPTGI